MNEWMNEWMDGWMNECCVSESFISQAEMNPHSLLTEGNTKQFIKKVIKNYKTFINISLKFYKNL